jgi:transcriptional regulator with GAF, ATPase, and Fis domain
MPTADRVPLTASSPGMRRVLELVDAVAATDASVLVMGETGTGKEVVARELHARSARRAGPFVAVNVAAIPRDLVESTLFGHERGAFTGAHQDRAGRFELARGGTLFLDEVGELGLDAQVKLLRVLQEGRFERVGGDVELESDARIVAATNRDLGAAIRAGTFREDLYFRLNVVPLHLPPLRERPGEIPALAERFAERYARRYGRETPRISAEVLGTLARCPWPGNVRELEHLVHRMVAVACPRAQLELADLPSEYRDAAGAHARPPEAGRGSTLLRDAVDAFERDFILGVLRRCGWSRNEAAGLLGIHPATMFRKLNRHGLYDGGVAPLRQSAGRRARSREFC